MSRRDEESCPGTSLLMQMNPALEAPTYDTKIGRSPEDALQDRDFPEASLPFRECFPRTMSRRDEESCPDVEEKHLLSTSARRSRASRRGGVGSSAEII
ncbi:hypothetical protein F511_27629 [Dorcoceras hygrometricum]|uniref:Uncharacterized protein n=1 Tax=Dorcoceras hygrometricum TaxID=472368 RepID=A0A2Z7D0Z4_9LAMI|nr:hypothetical protein F511_27629 [Dorcoceras hygrometricum]